MFWIKSRQRKNIPRCINPKIIFLLFFFFFPKEEEKEMKKKQPWGTSLVHPTFLQFGRTTIYLFGSPNISAIWANHNIPLWFKPKISESNLHEFTWYLAILHTFILHILWIEKFWDLWKIFLSERENEFSWYMCVLCWILLRFFWQENFIYK